MEMEKDEDEAEVVGLGVGEALGEVAMVEVVEQEQVLASHRRS